MTLLPLLLFGSASLTLGETAEAGRGIENDGVSLIQVERDFPSGPSSSVVRKDGPAHHADDASSGSGKLKVLSEAEQNDWRRRSVR